MDRAIEVIGGIYAEKIGTDNLLLFLTGFLFFVLFFLKRREAKYRRFWIYFYCGFFFSGYSFLNDAYRIKILRPYLLFGLGNFVFWRSLVLFVFLLPLYIKLISDIIAILQRMIKDSSKSS